MSLMLLIAMFLKIHACRTYIESTLGQGVSHGAVWLLTHGNQGMRAEVTRPEPFDWSTADLATHPLKACFAQALHSPRMAMVVLRQPGTGAWPLRHKASEVHRLSLRTDHFFITDETASLLLTLRAVTVAFRKCLLCCAGHCQHAFARAKTGASAI